MNRSYPELCNEVMKEWEENYEKIKLRAWLQEIDEYEKVFKGYRFHSFVREVRRVPTLSEKELTEFWVLHFQKKESQHERMEIGYREIKKPNSKPYKLGCYIDIGRDNFSRKAGNYIRKAIEEFNIKEKVDLLEQAKSEELRGSVR